MHRYPFWLAVVWVMAVRILAAEHGVPPARLALLVGVAKYEGDALSELPGCLNDVKDVEQLLLTKYGFTQDGIKTLVNEQATHQAIVKTFQQHLIDRAGSQSTVVFYFSGHGSQMPDEPGGEETDGFDETICPYDARSDQKYDITDDEVAGLLAALRAKARNVTVIFDSCHSGNASKGLVRTSWAPPDTRPPPPRAPYAIASRGMVDPSLWDASQYTFLSACQSDQLAIQQKCDNVWRSIFTCFLMDALRHGSPALTMRDALEEARARVKARNGNQNPTSEGNLDRIPFGEALPAPRPFFQVTGADGEYSLKGGKVHGVTVGSEFEMYAPGTKEFTEANRLCQARVREVAPFTATLDLIGSLPKSLQAARAVESKHVFVDQAQGVYVKIAATGLQTAVKEAVKSVPGAVVTDDRDLCRLVITDAAHGSPTPKSIRIMDATESIEFARMTPAAAASGTQLPHALQRVGAWLRAVDLHNPTTAFEGEFKVTKVVDEDLGSRSIFTPELILNEGEKADIYVKNGSAKSFYLYVLDYSSDGSISQVFPRSGAPDLIAPGGEFRDRIRVTLPPGRESLIDVLKVVVTGKPVDFSAILTDPEKPHEPAPEEPKAVLSNHWAVTQRVFKLVR